MRRHSSSVLKKCILAFSLLFSIVFSLSAVANAAGGINSEESRVLTVARGSFEYEGEKYVAKRYFVDQLIAYMSREDIDLSAEQADSAISKIYANVETGVREGYIVKIHDDEESQKVKEGKIVKEKDGSVIAFDHYGNTIMKSDGILRNTGYSLQNVVVTLIVLGCVFLCVIALSVKEIIVSKGGRHES